MINTFLSILASYFLWEHTELLHNSGMATLAAFLLILLVLFLASFLYNRPRFRQFYHLNRLILFFLKELVIANLKVSWEVITPRNHLRPAVIAVPLSIDKDLEIMLLANMITLTPGTLSLDVSEDKKYLYVHTLYAENELELFRNNIKEGFEKLILASRLS